MLNSIPPPIPSLSNSVLRNKHAFHVPFPTITENCNLLYRNPNRTHASISTAGCSANCCSSTQQSIACFYFPSVIPCRLQPLQSSMRPSPFPTIAEVNSIPFCIFIICSREHASNYLCKILCNLVTHDPSQYLHAFISIFLLHTLVVQPRERNRKWKKRRKESKEVATILLFLAIICPRRTHFFLLDADSVFCPVSCFLFHNRYAFGLFVIFVLLLH
jgi:hypothetical protein